MLSPFPLQCDVSQFPSIALQRNGQTWSEAYCIVYSIVNFIVYFVVYCLRYTIYHTLYFSLSEPVWGANQLPETAPAAKMQIFASCAGQYLFTEIIDFMNIRKQISTSRNKTMAFWKESADEYWQASHKHQQSCHANICNISINLALAGLDYKVVNVEVRAEATVGDKTALPRHYLRKKLIMLTISESIRYHHWYWGEVPCILLAIAQWQITAWQQLEDSILAGCSCF